MDIKEIIRQGRPANDIIADLRKVSRELPAWSELEKEYNPRKHQVHTDPDYVDKFKKGRRERMTRITFGWQKLAVKRMAGLMFGIDVARVYKDHDNENEKRVARIMEAIYVKNHIDTINKERAKWLFASCEAMTLWYTQEADTTYAGESTRYKLRCKNYSPFSNRSKKSEAIYALFDEYADLVALSIAYSRAENGSQTDYFETYTADTHIRWRGTTGAMREELRETYEIGKIPGVYISRPEPIWEDQSDNISELEWSHSRNGNYIRKNSRPTWVVASNENIEVGQEAAGDNEGRNVLRYPADAKYGYATWNQSIDALKLHTEEIKRNFFMELQLPDMSMDNMKSTPMSGEARKMVFIDAQMKVEDESGAWIELFEREDKVIRCYMKKMYPSLATAIDNLEIEHRITPYQIKDEAEKLTNIQTATGGKPFMSQRTAIKEAGYVDDIDAELEELQGEDMADLSEPTI